MLTQQLPPASNRRLCCFTSKVYELSGSDLADLDVSSCKNMAKYTVLHLGSDVSPFKLETTKTFRGEIVSSESTVRATVDVSN